MNRIVAVFYFLAAIVVIAIGSAGCAQLTDFRAQLVKQTADLNHKPSDVWTNTADRGGE